MLIAVDGTNYSYETVQVYRGERDIAGSEGLAFK
jgi:hypothetical protein